MNAGTGRTGTKLNLPRIVVLALYVAGLAAISVYSYRHPLYNWDMLAYMGLVVQKETSDIQKIHDETYRQAKEHMPATEYGYLLGGPKRQARYESADTFYALLPLYAVKPMYVELVNAFYKAGFSLPAATLMPSIISYILCGLLLFYWLARIVSFYWAAIIGFTISFSGFMVFAARLSTPDLLSAFFLLLAFFLIMEKRNLHGAFVVMLLSLFTRLDNIVVCSLIVTFLFFNKKWQPVFPWKKYLLFLGSLAVCYFIITAITLRPFGWNIFYYHDFVKRLDLGGATHLSFSLKNYFRVLDAQVFTALLHYNFFLFLTIIFIILYTPAFRFKMLSFEQQFVLLFLVIIACRFILFPDLSDRFHIPYYLCTLILLFKRVAQFPIVSQNQSIA